MSDGSWEPEDAAPGAGPTLGLTVTGRTLPVDGDPAHAATEEPGARPGSARTLAPLPERLGRYRVERELGAGGMGVVYLARDPELDRRVAVKLLGPGLTRGQSLARAQARMRREARVMARLEHPNVVRVYEVGVTEGQLFVAMEYIEGQTLDAWLAEAPRSWAEVASVFLQAGEGLLAAHEVGIVHRDFKPHNLLVELDTGAAQLVGVRARVLDFGLAALSHDELDAADDANAAGASGAGPGSEALRLTRTGALMGTPAYMAPEQFLGQIADHRADQFAFCIALYEALYGERPFAGETFEDLRRAVLAGELREPPVSGVPGWLRALVLRGLATEPEARWPSLRELLVELADRLDRAVSEDLNRSAGRRTRTLLFAGMAVAILAAGASVLGVFRGQSAVADGPTLAVLGGSLALTILALLILARSGFARTRYNRRAIALLVGILGGALANLLNSSAEDLPLRIADRHNLVILAVVCLLGSVSLERWMIAVSGFAILAWALSFAFPIAAGAGFGLGFAGLCGLLALGGPSRVQGGGELALSTRRSQASRSGRTGSAERARATGG